MKITGAVFDLDHTLFDRYATLRALAPFLVERLGEDLMPGVDPRRFAEELSAADRLYIVEGWERIFSALIDRGILRKSADFSRYAESLYAGFRRTAVPFPFEDDFFRALRERELKVALITNGSESVQGAKLGLLDMARRFDEIVIADGEKIPKKPDPAPFRLMAERLGEEPGTLLYAGDNPLNDVDGSRRAGYIPVWVRTTGVWCEGIEKAPYEVDTVAELPALIDRLRNEA